MKNFVLSAMALLAFGFANAQEEEVTTNGFAKGNIFVSGTVGFSSEKTDGNKEDMFNIKPSLGYFVTDNIAVGVGLGFDQTKPASKLKTTGFSADLFGRYYVTPANKFSVFGQLAAGYQNFKKELGSGIDDFKTDGFRVAFNPGISYFVSRSFALEASFGAFEYTNTKPKGGKSTNDYNFGFDLANINFGLVYKF